MTPSPIQRAVERAVEGGYIEPFPNEDMSPVFLDPAFWRALGKALGWEKYGTNNTIWQHVETWKYHWHRFIDHLASGGTADSFFGELLSR